MHTFNPLTDLPMGLGASLSQNSKALEYFSALSPDEQRQVIDGSRSIQTNREMKAYWKQLSPEYLLPF